jgi:hypothetical protein
MFLHLHFVMKSMGVNVTPVVDRLNGVLYDIV